jgi:D-alanyl-D-alanine dipeptidase
MYFESGFSKTPKIFGRKGVLNRIIAALELIPSSYGIEIWDVYRPREVQRTLYEWMRAKIRKSQPNLTDEESQIEAKKYAAVPSKIGDAYCPPHLSGGAIDLTLFDSETKREVDMGTIFDDCTEVAHSEYFESKHDLTSAMTVIRDRRRILRNAMKAAGFTPYHYEWWHYDLGNVLWAKNTGMKAVFGPLFNDLEYPL